MAVTTPRPPRVLNKHRDRATPGSVYVGRGSPHGNPFRITGKLSRAQVIKKFECEVLPYLDCEPLRGRDLICFCKPLACHADLLLEKANREKIE